MHPAAFGGRFARVYIGAILPPQGRDPWTAIGYHVDDGRRHPKAWTSTDGRSWTEADLPPTGPGEEWDRPFVATRKGGTIVTFGLRGEDGQGGIVAWTWEDRSGWSLLTDVGRGDLVTGSVDVLELGANGYVAVGARHSAGGSSIDVFRSRTGLPWSRHGIEARTDERIDGTGYASSGSREVIVGRTWPFSPPFDDYDGAIWWSEGDDRWTRVEPESAAIAAPRYDAVQDVVAFRGGFVAVGLVGDPPAQPTAWVSTDGRDWSSHVIEGLEGVGAGASKVALVGDRLVAIGKFSSGPELAAWESRDGRRWSRIELPDELTSLVPAEQHDVAGGPNGELAIVAQSKVESEIYIGYPE